CIQRIESDTRVCLGDIHLGSDPQANKPVTKKRTFIRKVFHPGVNIKEMDEKGIVHFLATNGKAEAWKNPMDEGLLHIRMKSLAPNSKPANSIVGNKSVRCVTKSEPDSYVIIDFGERRVCPSYYKLRHYSYSDRDALRNWRLEGCQESSAHALSTSTVTEDIDINSKWDVLIDHKNDESLKKAGQIHQWKIPDDVPQKFYHKFRILITGPNSSGTFALALTAFEIYGTLELPPPTSSKVQLTHRFAIIEVSNVTEEVEQALLSISGITVKAPSGCEQEFLEPEKGNLALPRQTSASSEDSSSGAVPDIFQPPPATSVNENTSPQQQQQPVPPESGQASAQPTSQEAIVPTSSTNTNAAPVTEPAQQQPVASEPAQQPVASEPIKATTETLPSNQYILVDKPEQKKEKERYVLEPIVSQLQIIRFSELPDMHIAKDTFLKGLFLKESESVVTTKDEPIETKEEKKDKDTTEQSNVNEAEDKKDSKHSKENLKDQWKALFKTIVFRDIQANSKEEITQEAFTQLLSQNPEVQELILSLYEQLEINDETTILTWEQVQSVIILLIKINPKVVFDWVYANGYDHYGTRRFNNNFESSLQEQIVFQKNIVTKCPHFDTLFLKHCFAIAEKLGFHSLQQLRPMYIRHVLPEEVQSDPSLRDLLLFKDETPVEMLRLRFSAFRCLNAVVAKMLAFVNLSNYEMLSSLAHLICIVGDEYIFTQVKTDFLQSVMDATSQPVEKKPVVRMNRMKLLNKLSTVGSLDFATESNFGFGYQQLSHVDESQLRPPKPQGADPFVAFVLELIGQFVEGDTGPYRQYFSDVSNELQSPESYLFQLTPNGRRPQLDLMNKDKFIIRPSHPNLLLSASSAVNANAAEETAHGDNGADVPERSAHKGASEGLNIQSAKDSANLKEEQFGMCEFLGKLIGMCLRTGVKLNLSLPAFFWKPLVGVSCGRKDLYEIDTFLCKGLDEIWNYPPEKKDEFENEVKETFMTTLSDMTLVELKPNGSEIPVTYENRKEYVSLVYQARLNEHMPHMEYIRRGIHKIVPIHVLSLFTWEELERLICGVPQINVDLLRRHTVYDKAIEPNSDYIQWFWEILNELSPENKRKFIRFTWAQERLPNDDEEFARLRLRFLIKPVVRTTSNIDRLLPKAHTCFFHLELPQYSTKEIMKERLLLAITESLSMNADEPGRDDLNQAAPQEDSF
ncbi:HECT domain and RCC1-like domain-containing protein, partial [Reticulomyxa filosa]